MKTKTLGEVLRRITRLVGVGLFGVWLTNTAMASTAAIALSSAGTDRNDWNEYVGLRFTTGPVPLIVDQLGRWVVSSGGSHTVRIVDPNNGCAVVATASVNTSSAPTGQFKYQAVSGGPVTLMANHTYFLMSQESSGGDHWYGADTVLNATKDLTIDCPAYVWPGTGVYYSNVDPNNGGLPNHCYGPVGFTYSLGASGTVTSGSMDAVTGAAVGKLRNDFGGLVGFKFSTGDKELKVTELGRWVVSGNSGNHLVKIIDPAASDAVVTSAYVNTSGATAGMFKYAAVGSAATLAANHVYYLVSDETSSGDLWGDSNTGLISSDEITITNPVYYDSGYLPEPSNGTTNHGFGPVSFRYQTPGVIATVTPGAVGTRNDWPNYVGFRFETGDRELNVTHLGRWVLSGNSHTHALKIVDPSAGNATVASATVNLSGATAGAFVYAALDTSVVLAANHEYYVMSLESDTSGSDYWYTGHCGVTPTGDITIVAPQYQQDSSYYTDGSPGDQGNYSYGPVSFLYTPVRPGWTFQTDSTTLKLDIYGAPFITQLAENNTQGWDWITSPSVVPLPRRVYVSDSARYPNWIFGGASVNNDDGKKVTLTYTSSTPALTLTQTWHAYPGVGPVENKTTITNSSGDELRYDQVDVVPSDLGVTAEATATLWQFNRGNTNHPSDHHFTTGTVLTSLSSQQDPAIDYRATNILGSGDYFLPFTLLQVGGDTAAGHGLYYGYDKPYGQFQIDNKVWGSDPNRIRAKSMLWWEHSFNQVNGASTELPGIFYGTYRGGDADYGTNVMKKWFWAHKMTPTIRANTQEPLITVAAPLDTADYAEDYFDYYPDLAQWGVQLVKEDAQWLSDFNANYETMVAWTPNTTYWPSGFTLPKLVHDNGLLLDLYMSNTFQGGDMADSTDRATELNALVERFAPDGVTLSWLTAGDGFDYWRSDINYEASLNYNSHLGFLKLMDDMITVAGGSGFRWENTSAASKKSFDLLERQSWGCTNDERIDQYAGAIEYFRMVYYANSYVINPVQLCDQNDDFYDYVQHSYNPAYYSEAKAKYSCRTGFLSAWMHWLAAGYNPHDDVYEEHVALYATYQRPILRGANVYHILPIADQLHWDGIQLFNPGYDGGKGSVLLFKPNSGASYVTSAAIVFKGLTPTKHYTLTFQDRNDLNDDFVGVTGTYLMTTGIGTLTGPSNDWDSEIIWIDQTD
jgi:hypothetical protein